MQRIAFFVYGVICYLLFLAVYAYLAAFTADWLVPKSVDSGPGGSVAVAVAVDLLLLGLFAAQHSIMARPAFKEVWTRLVPRPIERSTYVLVANLVTILLMWQWRPIDLVVWDVQSTPLRAILWGLFAVGVLLVPGVTMMISHWDLFGLRQVWLHWKELPYTSLPFRTPLLYAVVRHPLYLAWTLFFWATPTMTAGHLLLAGVMTLYMALAAQVEERDLVSHYGEHYEAYRRRVPQFIPRLSRGTPASWKEAPAKSQAAESGARP